MRHGNEGGPGFCSQVLINTSIRLKNMLIYKDLLYYKVLAFLYFIWAQNVPMHGIQKVKSLFIPILSYLVSTQLFR